jgi:hypothetical protein
MAWHPEAAGQHAASLQFALLALNTPPRKIVRAFMTTGKPQGVIENDDQSRRRDNANAARLRDDLRGLANPALVEAASVHGVSKWTQRAGRHLQPGGMIYIRFPAGKLKIFPK